MASASSVPPAPTTDEVKEITLIRDPVVRNLRITECYSRLSASVAQRTDRCSNWCTFATWASRQAGATIRGEDFLDRLTERSRVGATLRRPVNWMWRRLLRRGLLNPQALAGRIVKAIHSPFDALERASGAVARGNLKVFEEIGYEFARYLATSDLPGFLQELRPGPPPDGQDLLRNAFTRYARLSATADPAVRAQHILLANIEIGLHEQTRLQPEIQRALEAVSDTKDDLLGRTVLSRAVLWLLTPVTRSYRKAVRELVRRVITDSMMVLRLPGVTLALGDHLHAPYPDILRKLSDADLLALLKQYEPHDGECTNCGAEDWSDLRQRMHYILNLFRAFHSGGQLLDPPFRPEQTELILQGRLPQGRL
jgi:hypothetical protein